MTQIYREELRRFFLQLRKGCDVLIQGLFSQDTLPWTADPTDLKPDYRARRGGVTCTSQQWYAMMRPSRTRVEKLMMDLKASE